MNRGATRSWIAHYKVPRYVEFETESPRTVSGKVQIFKLREMALESLGLSKAATVKIA